MISNYSGSTLLDINAPNKWGESILENYKTRKNIINTLLILKSHGVV